MKLPTLRSSAKLICAEYEDSEDTVNTLAIRKSTPK